MRKFLALLLSLMLLCMSLGAVAEVDEITVEPEAPVVAEESVPTEAEPAGEANEEEEPKQEEDEIPEGAVVSEPHWSTLEPIQKVEPTCTEDGQYTYKCEHCGSLFTIAQEKLGGKHEGEIIEKHMTTCTELGYDLIKECTKCGAKNVKQYYDEQLSPHTFEKKNEKVVEEATCQRPLKLENKCIICGQTIQWTEGEKLPHDYQGVDEKPATCWEEGVSATVYRCTMCGAMDPENHDGAVIEKLDHEADLIGNFIYLTEDNADQYVNDILERDDPDYWDVPWGADIGYQYEKDTTKFNLPLKDYTVDAEGYYLGTDGKRICVDTAIDELKANGTYKWLSDGSYCTETWTYVAPTCATAGSLSVSCEKCGYTKTEVIPAMGHKYTMQDMEEWYHGIDCTKGMDVLYICDACGDVYKSHWGGFAAHDMEDYGHNISYIQKGKEYWAVEEYDEETDTYTYSLPEEICEGLDYVKRIHCVNPHCSVFKDVTVVGDPAKHAYDENPAYHVFQEPTCTEDGFEYFYCPKCKTATREVIPALGHIGEIEVDGKVKKGKIEITVKPTCTEEGVRTYYCARCDKVWYTERIPALGHKYEKDEKASKDFTCTIDGLLVEVCARCGDKKETVVPAHHVYPTTEDGEVDVEKVFDYVEPTCTKAGKISFHCTVCHAPIADQVIPALGHDRARADYVHEENLTDIYYEGIWYQEHTEATCSAPETYSYVCEICGKTVKKTVGKANPEAHEDYKEWDIDGAIQHGFVITEMPTCTKGGKAVYNCNICKKVVEVELDKLPHNMMTYWDGDAQKYVTRCEPMRLGDLETIKDKIDAIAPTLYDRLVTLTEDTEEQEFSFWIWDEEAEEDVEVKFTDKWVVGIGCGHEEVLKVEPTKYTVTLSADKRVATATLEPDTIPLNEAYAYVVWSWTLADGTNLSLSHTYEMTRNSVIKNPQFKIGNANTPDGATLDYILVIVTNNEDASGITEANVGDYGYAMFTE